jgi:DNA polymerase-3 subunit gamma/tau
MSYVVLARKYRPKNFTELIGQAPVVRALTNALDNNRLHHAYLLTGTRGIGKTTLGRILAKCFNCQTAVSASPCGTCASCQEIDAGHSLDLIEIDAASNTRVEDTRELLDNVQYAPSRDRYKIYLIDEVHMLSNHSFNALLKTLEEPPEHVKFILATTDPQKLPITVLSRCLQFNLHAMPPKQISSHLQNVIATENIDAEADALLQLAVAANGSMRDALSLLDQAIAYSNNQITTDDVCTMLGNVNDNTVYHIIAAIAEQNSMQLFALVAELAEQAVDYQQVLDNILLGLHHIALTQANIELPSDYVFSNTLINKLADMIHAEDIQLYYQIALIGKRDLPLAPAPRSGFEMVLLRMLYFTPNKKPNNVMQTQSITLNNAKPEKKTITVLDNTVADWESIIEHANLSGVTKILANHCILKKHEHNIIELEVDSSHAAMASDAQKKKLQQALTECLNKQINLTIHSTQLTTESPAKKQQRVLDEHKQQALENINNDPNVKELLEQFDASIQTESITITK